MSNKEECHAETLRLCDEIYTDYRKSAAKDISRGVCAMDESLRKQGRLDVELKMLRFLEMSVACDDKEEVVKLSNALEIFYSLFPDIRKGRFDGEG